MEQSFLDYMIYGPTSADLFPNLWKTTLDIGIGALGGILLWEWKGREAYKRLSDPTGAKDVVKIKERVKKVGGGSRQRRLAATTPSSSQALA